MLAKLADGWTDVGEETGSRGLLNEYLSHMESGRRLGVSAVMPPCGIIGICSVDGR